MLTLFGWLLIVVGAIGGKAAVHGAPRHNILGGALATTANHHNATPIAVFALITLVGVLIVFRRWMFS